MPRPRVALALFAHVLLALSLSACRDSTATTSPAGASGGAATGKPAPKGSFADLANRFEQACDQPGGAGKDEATRLSGPLLEAASRRLSELGVGHEVSRDDRVASLSIQAESGSPLGRLAASLRAAGDTRLVYDVLRFRDRPERPSGYDEQINVLRMPHAVLLRGGDVDEPNLRHEQARAEAWAAYRRGELSPYTARLIENARTRPHYADELHAWTSDLVRELQAVHDLLISPDDAPLTQADLPAVLAARDGGPPLSRPLTEFEARWDRLASAALHGAATSALFAPALKQAQTRAKGKSAAQFSPGARGVTALIEIDPPKGQAAPSFGLLIDMSQSTGVDDTKNPAHLRAQLAASLEAVERHAPHFAAVVELLRRVAATPSGAERRKLLKALAEVITPAPADAPAKSRTQAAYVERFELALQGKLPPAKK